MPPITNSSFELADPGAGNATGWTWTTSTSWHFARYQDSRFEGFETDWTNEPFIDELSEDTNVIDALYNLVDPSDCEGFEKEWNNNTFTFSLESASAAEYSVSQLPPTGTTLEGFEVGWPSNENALFSFEPSDVIAGVFDSNLFEWFEDWAGSYITAFENYMLSAALFMESGVAGSAETFEGIKFDLPLNVSPPNTINSPAHGFANGDIVTLFSAVDGQGGNLPTGLNDRTNYFVVGSATNTFQVSTSSGGTPQTFTDPGSGANFIRANTANFWVGKDGDTAGSDP